MAHTVYIISMSNCEAYEDYREWVDSVWDSEDGVRAYLSAQGFSETVHPLRAYDNPQDVLSDGMMHTWRKYVGGDDNRSDETVSADACKMDVNEVGDVAAVRERRGDTVSEVPCRRDYDRQVRTDIALSHVGECYRRDDAAISRICDDGNMTFVCYVPSPDNEHTNEHAVSVDANGTVSWILDTSDAIPDGASETDMTGTRIPPMSELSLVPVVLASSEFCGSTYDDSRAPVTRRRNIGGVPYVAIALHEQSGTCAMLVDMDTRLVSYAGCVKKGNDTADAVDVLLSKAFDAEY